MYRIIFVHIRMIFLICFSSTSLRCSMPLLLKLLLLLLSYLILLVFRRFFESFNRSMCAGRFLLALQRPSLPRTRFAREVNWFAAQHAVNARLQWCLFHTQFNTIESVLFFFLHFSSHCCHFIEYLLFQLTVACAFDSTKTHLEHSYSQNEAVTTTIFSIQWNKRMFTKKS